MRILHTAATYAPSLDGVAEVVRHISEELAHRGHEVHVATRAAPGLPRESALNHVQIHRFKVRGNLAKGMEGEVREYCEFVRSGRWDIVVNHCLQVWTTDALLRQVGSTSWRTLLVTHGLSLSDPTFGNYYRQMPNFLRRYTNWMTISAVNEEFAYARQHGLPEPAIIQNGVDLQEWKQPILDMREKWNIGTGPWLINVSNHSVQKGHSHSFQVASQLRGSGARFTLIGNSIPADKWRLGLAGVMGGCYYECLMKALVSDTIDLRTKVPRQQVVSAIQEADILVSTSNWEANSVVLLESMSAGTPWVSFDVGSARDNAGGLVVNTVGEMTETVTELLRDRDRRKSLGLEGRARARERHDWARIVDQYEELYECSTEQRV
ncbi:MAG TPA: glycosyltransferase family 4 protein [Candidatus Acidoferrales bacterium]|nr:glycosyltransferase family 4 protein [Candidatus Acidoferrales bacterium]